MSDIKLPMMYAKTYGTATDAKTNISSSALYKYLGWSKSRRKGTNATNGVEKNGVPLLMYLDIFKNFFANTQLKSYEQYTDSYESPRPQTEIGKWMVVIEVECRSFGEWIWVV